MNSLRLTSLQHRRLMTHLLPGDGKEAIAIALCGQAHFESRSAYTVFKIFEIPYEECRRDHDFVTWQTARLRDLLATARLDNLSILKIHSHPHGFPHFSDRDDISDRELFAAIARRVPYCHLSAIMLPNGSIFGRVVGEKGLGCPIDRVPIIGDDISISFHDTTRRTTNFDVRHRQFFGDRTTELLSQLSVGVVGISGTGSPVVEMLARLGVKRLVLIDPDYVEFKNLNRIYGAKKQDAKVKRNKALMMKTHIEGLGLGTIVEIFDGDVSHEQAVRMLSTCDMLLGCVDSICARDLLNRIATFYTLPYIDIGVRLDADGKGGVSSVSAAIHYLKPGGSSLKSRGVYDNNDLHADYLRCTDPDFYRDQVQRGYIRGINIDRPAVISINTAAAAAGVNEMLARLHPYRTLANASCATFKLLFSHGRTTIRADGEPDGELLPYIGRGDCLPLLMSPRVLEAA